MKVYILETGEEYQGKTLVSIHATKESAMEAAVERTQHYWRY